MVQWSGVKQGDESSHFGRECSLGNIDEVGAKLVLVCPMINCCLLKCFESGCPSQPIACDNSLRVHLFLDQLLRLTQKLASQHAHRSRTIADLVVLHFRDVNQHLGCGVLSHGVEGERDMMGRIRHAGHPKYPGYSWER